MTSCRIFEYNPILSECRAVPLSTRYAHETTQVISFEMFKSKVVQSSVFIIDPSFLKYDPHSRSLPNIARSLASCCFPRTSHRIFLRKYRDC